jgi:hypothetical protein
VTEYGTNRESKNQIHNTMFDTIIGFLGNHYSGIIGAGIGYWWAIYFSRRHEFNEAAEIIFAGLHRELEQHWSPSGNVTDLDFAILRRRLYWYQRRGFDRALGEYQKAKEECDGRDSTGGLMRIEPNRVKESTLQLLEYVKRR